MTTKKVRCQNCDAVIDAEEKRYFITKWFYEYRCYHCNSVRTVETSETYRLPKWERQNPPTLGVKVSDGIDSEDAVR